MLAKTRRGISPPAYQNSMGAKPMTGRNPSMRGKRIYRMPKGGRLRIVQTADEVLALWVEHELGVATGLAPEGLERPSPKFGLTAAEQGHHFVCSHPLYPRIGPRLYRRLIKFAGRTRKRRSYPRATRKLDERWIRVFVERLNCQLQDQPLQILPRLSAPGNLEESVRIVAEVERVAIEKRIRRLLS